MSPAPANWMTAISPVVLLVAATLSHAQVPHNQDEPPGPALSPAEAIARMTVPPCFSVELVASEPDLVNPVSMTFDEKGRIWVTESLEYPRREPGPGRDRVKVFQDLDGDGTADRHTIFADGLNIPSGIAVGHGGVWVANAPDLLFYPNADGDLSPDGPPQVVATGFGRADTHELPNSLTWGPDGWLYGWNGVFNPSEVQSNNGKTYQFTCAIFRIHPRTREFQVWCEGTSNPWGLALNENGDFFASACVIDHLWHLVESGYYLRQGGPYPRHTWPMGSIVDFRHQKAAYCGITFYDSDAYPPEFRSKLYMGNIHGNAINVDGLERNGATYRGTDHPDFLNAHDAWFMPVSQKTGPDGCLYVLDWYDRYHCYQDANRDPAGIDRLKGRLYRITFNQSPPRPPFDLAAQTDLQLIERLGSPNGFDRETALRLLTERLALANESPETRASLEALALDPNAPRTARLNALWSLIGAQKLTPELLDRLLTHPDSTFRAWGVRAAGDSPQLARDRCDAVLKLASDPSPDVLVQVAVASPKIADPQTAARSLSDVLALGETDPIVPHVAWQNLHPLLISHPGPLLDRLANGLQNNEQSSVWVELLPRIVERLIDTDTPNIPSLGRLFEILAHDPARHTDQLTSFLASLANVANAGSLQEKSKQELLGILNQKGKNLESLDSNNPAFKPLLTEMLILSIALARPEDVSIPAKLLAAGVVTGQQPLPDETRLRAFSSLIQTGATDIVLAAAEVTLQDPEHASPELRARLVSELSRLDSPGVSKLLLALYNQLPADIRPRAIVVLTERLPWARDLLDAIEQKQIPASALNVNQIRRLQQTTDQTLAERSRKLFGIVRDGRNEQRELVVAQMRRFLRETPGDPFSGRAVFNRVCAQCHQIYGQGQDVGPDLTGSGRNDWEQMISNVFDPSLVIGQGYQALTVATVDGRVLTGLLAEDSPQRIVLKVQGGKLEVIPRDQVEETKAAEVSLMPEDLEKQLSPQELADLFSFLALDRPPGDPEARLLPGAPSPKISNPRP